MKKLCLTIAAMAGLVLVYSGGAAAQGFLNPDPVDLGLENIEQENRYWCWAAIVQQLLRQPTYGNPPRQCELVNRANQEKGAAEAVDCCREPAGPGCGQRPADFPEIESLLNLYGLKVEPRPLPETPDSLYQTLLAGQTVLVGGEIEPGLNHLYLIKGLFWDGQDRLKLLVNDPARPGDSTLDFEECEPTWLVTWTIL